MAKVSKCFIAAVKLSDKRAYEIAHSAGLHHTVLSKLLCGIDKVQPGDRRVLAVANVLGLSHEDCFED